MTASNTARLFRAVKAQAARKGFTMTRRAAKAQAAMLQKTFPAFHLYGGENSYSLRVEGWRVVAR